MAKGVQPVTVLREHARELEAAMAVCLAEPKKKPVHRLRSSTRRIEAQLTLLGHVKDLPPFRKQAAKLLRELSKLRRAAGKIRDLDVHEDILEEFCKPADPHSTVGDRVRKEAEQVLAEQSRRRDQLAKKLVKLLQKREGDFAGAVEKLLKVLEAAEEVKVPAETVLELAEAEFARCFRQVAGGRKNGDGDGLQLATAKVDDDQLHALRKTAKLVRYMAEAAPGSRRARQVAKHYESLQEAGGQWHDWLELTGEAGEIVGARHRLTQHLRERRDDCRDAFLRALAQPKLS